MNWPSSTCFTVAGAVAVPQVGETGAGKTSFMKCLAGLEKPTSGDITVRHSKTITPNPSVELCPRFGVKLLMVTLLTAAVERGDFFVGLKSITV